MDYTSPPDAKAWMKTSLLNLYLVVTFSRPGFTSRGLEVYLVVTLNGTSGDSVINKS